MKGQIPHVLFASLYWDPRTEIIRIMEKVLLSFILLEKETFLASLFFCKKYTVTFSVIKLICFGRDNLENPLVPGKLGAVGNTKYIYV